MIVLALLILFLVMAPAAYAKGGSSRTVDAVGPKSQSLIDLENRFYGMANQIMDGYTGTYAPPQTGTTQPSAPSAGAGKGGAGRALDRRVGVPTNNPSIKRPFLVPVPDSTMPQPLDMSGLTGRAPASAGKGGARGGAPASSPQMAASAGKGGARGGANGGNYWSNDNLMGRLLNDATSKTLTSNARYDDLLRQSPMLSARSLNALSSAEDALGLSRGAIGRSQGILGQSLDALRQSQVVGDPYFRQANQNYADAKRLLGSGEALLQQAPSAGDWWYDQAKDAYARAGDMMNQNQEALRYASETDKWYSDYTKGQLAGAETLMNTGQVPQPILDALSASIRTGLDKSMGTGLNDLASRGILNSSVTNRGLADMSREAADSLNRGYLDAFKTTLEGYQGNANIGANAGKAFTSSAIDFGNLMNSTLGHAIGLGDSYGRIGGQRVSDLLNTAAGYTGNAQATGNLANSLMDAGSKRIQDQLAVAQGYGNAMQNQLAIAQGYGNLAGQYGNVSGGYLNNLNANLAEREQLNKAIQSYYTNAMAPMLPAYDLLKTMQQDHWNSNKKDTIVKQGK